MTATRLDISDHLTLVDGLPKPEWDAIAGRIEEGIGPDERFAVWTGAIRQWMNRMRSALGEGYDVAESEHFLATLPDGVPGDVVLRFAEKCRIRMLEVLPDIGAFSAPGKEALLLFRDRATCDKYLSLWSSDADTDRFLGGAHVREGYPHVAATGLNYDHLEDTLAHELIHLSLCHLRLPLWIEEGLS